MSAKTPVTEYSDKPLSWVGAGNPAARADIRPLLLDIVDESDLFRLREPPYPGIDELVSQIKAHGQTTPLFVRPKADGRFELISGYRRRAALERMESPQALCRVYQGLSDGDAYALAVSENADRDDLTDWERALACLKLEGQGRKQDEIARMFRWSDARHVRNYIRVAAQSLRVVSEALQGRKLQMTHALALSKLVGSKLSQEDQERIAKDAIARQLSVRAIEALIEKELSREPGPEVLAVEEPSSPVSVRRAKDGSVTYKARIDPSQPSEWDAIADELKKALKLIATLKKKQSGATSVLPHEAEAS